MHRAFERLQRDVAGEAVGDDHVGAAPGSRSRPSTLPTKPFTSAKQRRRRACAARRPCPALRRSTAARSSARRRRAARVAYARASSAHSHEPLRVGVDGRAAVDEQLHAVLAEHRERDRDRGPVHALDPAEAQQRGGHRRAGVAGADHRRGAPVAHRLGAAHERRVLLGAHRGRGLVVHRDDFGRVEELDPRRARAVGQVRARARRAGRRAARRRRTSSTAAQRAGDDLRRRAVAAHRVDRDHGRHGSSSLATRRRGPGGLGTSRSCCTPCAAAATRRSSGTASARGGREPHVRRLARAGRGAAHLALRDGHGFAAPVT